MTRPTVTEKILCPFDFCQTWVNVLGKPARLAMHKMPDVSGRMLGETCPASLAPWPLTPSIEQTLHDQKLSMWRRKQLEVGEEVAQRRRHAEDMEDMAARAEYAGVTVAEMAKRLHDSEPSREPMGTRGNGPPENMQLGGREDQDVPDAFPGSNEIPPKPNGAHYGGVYQSTGDTGMSGIEGLVAKANAAHISNQDGTASIIQGVTEVRYRMNAAIEAFERSVDILNDVMQNTTSERLSEASHAIYDAKLQVQGNMSALGQGEEDVKRQIAMANDKIQEWIGIVTSA